MKKIAGCIIAGCCLTGYVEGALAASAAAVSFGQKNQLGAGSASDWQLVWADEFDKDGLPDSSKWGCEEGFIRNEEPQYYTRTQLENARVEAGMLVIEGRKEKIRNAQYDPGSTDWRRSREYAEYTSASLNTLGKADWTYGRMEARAKVPAGSGVWPAFWMMGVNRLPPLAEPKVGQVGWPFCGEIDIMEFIGEKPYTVHAAAHFPNLGTGKPQARGKTITVDESPSNAFHVYAVEWSPDQINYFYDDQLYYSVPVDVAGKGADNPFRRPHYILLNLALGQWGGEIDKSLLPQNFFVDYVRVYQRKSVPKVALNASALWKQYCEAKQTGGEPELADFSFAGYHNGETSIPSVDWKVFDVTKFGAKPNDRKSDKAALVKAVAAAEANGSGIVFFPPGRFLINEPTDPKNQPVRIGGSRIVLRGSGSGKGGTELFMNLHLEPTDPEKLYSCPFMIEFKGKGETKTKTAVLADVRRETHSLEVENASLFRAGDWVLLHVQDNSPEAVAEAVAPYKPDPGWKKIIKQGVMVDEFHRIEQIDSSRLLLKEPIHVDVKASQGWTVIKYKPLKEVGVEGIAFRGNWHGHFVHHRSFDDDSGWSGVALSRSVNSWIRNCRFTDWSRAVAIKACAATTVQNLVLDGNAGHNAVSVHNSSHVMVRDIKDTAGHWHACGVAGECSGNVFLNCEYSKDTCFEAHASQPRWTLFDNITGGWKYGRWGGAQASQPNHLRGLVFWNYNNTGSGEPGDYHFIRPDSVYGRIIMPYVIGFYGNSQAFDKSQIEVLESNGSRVWPDSLYNAQFELRMGRLMQHFIVDLSPENKKERLL